MDDEMLMQVLQTNQNAANIKPRFVFLETSSATDVEPEISSSEQVHDKIQTLSILEGLDHIHQKRMFEGAEQHSFIDDRIDRLLVDDLDLEHLLNGELFFCFFVVCAPYFAKATLAQDIFEVELVLQAVGFIFNLQFAQLKMEGTTNRQLIFSLAFIIADLEILATSWLSTAEATCCVITNGFVGLPHTALPEKYRNAFARLSRI